MFLVLHASVRDEVLCLGLSPTTYNAPAPLNPKRSDLGSRVCPKSWCRAVQGLGRCATHLPSASRRVYLLISSKPILRVELIEIFEQSLSPKP